MARQASVETQFGANCFDRMKLGEWANTSQIPQARTNLKISFLSSRHEVNLSSFKFRPCLDLEDKDRRISPERLVFDQDIAELYNWRSNSKRTIWGKRTLMSLLYGA